jgi:hypothetical protein
MREFEVCYQDVVLSSNAGGMGARHHWSRGAKEKKRWENIWLQVFMQAEVPRRMSRCDADVKLEFRTGRRRDVENYRAAFVKPFADALVYGGYIPDDSEDFFRVTSFEILTNKRLDHAIPLTIGRTVVRLSVFG